MILKMFQPRKPAEQPRDIKWHKGMLLIVFFLMERVSKDSLITKYFQSVLMTSPGKSVQKNVQRAFSHRNDNEIQKD